MKNVLLLLPILLFLSIPLFAQQRFQGERIKFNDWRPNKVLTLTSDSHSDQIQITAVSQRVRPGKKRFKSIKYNEDKFQLVEKSRVFNLLDQQGNLVAKTNKDRKTIFLSDNRSFTRWKANPWSNTLEYRDTEGNAVATAKVVRGIPSVINHGDKSTIPVALICLEEILRYERNNNSGSWADFVLLMVFCT